MAESKLHVVLLRYTPNPEEIVAQAAKLCYSPASVEELKKQVESKEQSEFVKKLTDMRHLSPIEHVTFTFGIEGISRACSHQLVRHRLASYSQQSQRYVGQHSKISGGFDFIIPPSIEKIGKWPWDRSIFAELLKKTEDAKIIGLDLSLFEPSSNDKSLIKFNIFNTSFETKPTYI